MQKILLSVLFGLILSPLFAQETPLMNGNMEEWVDTLSYDKPEGWTTHGTWAIPAGVTQFTVSKTFVNVEQGLFSAILESKTALLFGAIPIDIPGMITNGTSTLYGFDSVRISGGAPWTARPETFRGWFDNTPVSGDEGRVLIQLWKWNGSSRDMIATGDLAIPATSGFEEFELTLDYMSTDDPDSMFIVVSASTDLNLGLPGSLMYVDSMSFSYPFIDTINGIGNNPAASLGISIYPNPSTGVLLIDNPQPQNAHADLYNAMGQIVGSYALKPGSNRINLPELPSGAYYYRVVSEDGFKEDNGKFILQ